MVPALVAPSILRPANWLWFKFGMLLHMIVTPVVMAAVFFTAVSATGIAMRLLGKNLLQLKPPKRRADSYWIPRHPPGPAPESLKDQF